MLYLERQRIFKTKRFAQQAETVGLSDSALKAAVFEVKEGLFDANLGGNLVKKRVAIGSKGKSGGVRTILVFRGPTAHVFCVFVFAKNYQANISSNELHELKMFSKALTNLTESEIGRVLKIRELYEVT